MTKRSLEKIDTVVVHCSDSGISAHDDISIIREWHLARGFSDVGYHLFITQKGKVQKGRPFDVVGAHCEGNNQNSIGICLGGRNTFPSHQLDVAAEEIRKIMNVFGIHFWNVRPHNHFNKDKSCPNFGVFQEILWRIYR